MTQQQAPIVCMGMCVIVRERERNTEDLQCKSSSTIAAKWHLQQIQKRDQNRELPLPAKPNIMKSQHNLQAHDDIYGDQNAKYNTPLNFYRASFCCNLVKCFFLSDCHR